MKKLLKLVFIAVIAGVTYKYLSEKDIKLSELLVKAKEWVADAARDIDEKVKKDAIVSPFAGGQGDVNDDSRSAYDSYSSGLPGYGVETGKNDYSGSSDNGPRYSEENSSNSTDADEAGAEEYLIEEKIFPGSERFPELDRIARETTEQQEASMATLVDWLTRHASDDLGKERLIFTWIATHVAYDDYGFNTGNYSDTSPEGVFRNRVSVCHGYSELFTALCRLAGLEAVTVIGYAKGITYSPGSSFSDTNHAWNAVKINGEWKLVDVTWSAGYGKAVHGKLVTVSEFTDYWFNPRPDEVIFSHLPEDESWQLIEPHITKYQFENIPYVSSLFFSMGFNGSQCLPAVLNGTISGLPEAYLVSGNIRVISMPYDRRIPSGKKIKLRVRADEGVKIAWKNGGNITDMKKEGNEYSAVIRTVPGELKLMASSEGDGMSYWGVLEYTVE